MNLFMRGGMPHSPIVDSQISANQQLRSVAPTPKPLYVIAELLYVIGCVTVEKTEKTEVFRGAARRREDSR